MHHAHTIDEGRTGRVAAEVKPGAFSRFGWHRNFRLTSVLISSMTTRLHPSRTILIVRRVYHHVEIGLWATLVAYVIFFLTFVIPNVSKAVSRAERLRTQEIAAEHKLYCEKWGMMEGTHAHTLCTLDLQEFRRKIERRVASENLRFVRIDGVAHQGSAAR